jgi:DNA polymerase-1
MKLLIDGDMLLIRACEAATSEVIFDDDIWHKWTDEKQARGNYWEYVSALSEVSSVPIEDAVHCFTARSQFRRDLFPGYKTNRKGVKPMGYKVILQSILSSESYAFQYNEIEADDLIGIFADKFREEGCVIASGDKDLKQIPGQHVWLDKELHHISNNDAQRFFYGQVLTGDSTDGIPGCPKIGAKTAEPIVNNLDPSDPVGCWEKIVSVYREKGKVERPDEFALLQARLVHILRDGEYDFHTHQVRLWTPPIATIP